MSAPEPDVAKLRLRVAELIGAVSAGAVPAEVALTATVPLVDLGLDSLGLLRLIDALELEYGVEIDLAASGLRLDSVDSIVDRLAGDLIARSQA